MDYKRKDQQTKKDLYRRLAHTRKSNWAAQHQSPDHEAFNSHFIHQDASSTEDFKTKKIIKGELRTDQKLRNRVAAQESRQRHRCYVEHLERKLKVYEDLLERQETLCKNCKKNLLCEPSLQSESMTVEHQPQNLLNSCQSQDQLLNSYLNDQMVRIDNGEASSPFGIFFVISLIAVLAVFSLGSGNQSYAPRLLANYHSTVNQLIDMEERLASQNQYQQAAPKVMALADLENAENWQGLQHDENRIMAGKVELGTNVSKNGANYGDYICSQPSLVVKKKAARERKGPEFLLLRTGRNPSDPPKKLKVTLDEKQGHRINIEANEWQGLQISSCFRKDL